MTRPTVSIQAAIGPSTTVGKFVIGTSLIGSTAVIGGREIVGQGVWVELGQVCSQLSVRRGRQRLLEQYPAGTCSAAFDDANGYLNPALDGGPYSEGDRTLRDQNGVQLTDENGNPLNIGESGVSTIRPMRAISVVLTHAGIDYPRYYGFSDYWNPQPAYPEGGVVVMGATDAFKIFTRINPFEQAFVGDGEDTGARLNRILDLADWSTPNRDIDTGDNTHQSTNLAQPIATQMRLASDSERGDLYIDGRGYPTFRRRLSRYAAFRSRTSQWTIGDGDGEFNPSAWNITNDDDLVRNDVNLARIGGSIINRRNAVAEISYLRSTYTRTDLTLDDDAQVTEQAEDILFLFAEQTPRVDFVEFEPDGIDDDNLWAMVCGAVFGDRVTVNLRHPTGTLFTGDYFIEGIEDDLVPVGSLWRTRFQLADASQFPTNVFIIGVSRIGGTDVLV